MVPECTRCNTGNDVTGNLLVLLLALLMVSGYAGGMSGDRWLSVAEAARELGLGESTVRSMAATGRLPAYRPGRRAYLVDKSELREFIAKPRSTGQFR